MGILKTIRYWLSITLTELPSYLVKLNRKNDDWLYVINRKQKIAPAPRNSGLCLLEEYTSQLRAPKLFPALSKMIFKKAVEDYEFQFSKTRRICNKPLVSYIIGHRGSEKVSHLNAVIQTIAAQSVDSIECIIVEQSSKPEVRDHLPDWVSYYHLEIGDADFYNRSLSFNYGAKKAKGRYLVLHDNDLLIPTCYTTSHIELLQQGFDVANLKRFIFGLNKVDTDDIFFTNNVDGTISPEYILQNAKGGGSLFLSSDAYQSIGGFDERFIGWGGEDNEIWQRAQTLNIYPFANLPMIHLWHAPQKDKRGGIDGGGLYTEALLGELSTISIYNRIESLKNS